MNARGCACGDVENKGASLLSRVPSRILSFVLSCALLFVCYALLGSASDDGGGIAVGEDETLLKEFDLSDKLRAVSGRGTDITPETAVADEFFCTNSPYIGEEMSVSASSAVLCTEGGRLMFAKNANTALPMASITKVMTALVALESEISLTEQVSVSKSAVGVEGSSVYLCEGDTLTVEALLYAVMLESANDASVALAVAVAGSEEDFVILMNNTAKRLGMSSTLFKNPHGLSSDGHATTACDYARLMSYALKNEVFRTIISTKRKNVFIGDIQRVLINHNRLLYSCRGMLGGKTGYTLASGRTLVTACERDGVTLICVTLNAADDWNDHRKLYDRGFSMLIAQRMLAADEAVELPLVGATQASVIARPSYGAVTICSKAETADIRLVYPRFIYAPVSKGENLGYAEIFFDGVKVAEIPLVSAEDADYYSDNGLKRGNPIQRIWKIASNKLGFLTEKLKG